MSVKTQGTELYFVKNGTANKLTCPTGISGLGGAKSQIDVTCLTEKEDQQFAAGLGQPGAVTVPFILDPSQVNHQDLFTLKESGEKIDWVVCLSDGTEPPTVATDTVTAPTGRSSAVFKGYVSDVTIEITTNEVVRGSLVIQRSGAVDWTWKAA